MARLRAPTTTALGTAAGARLTAFRHTPAAGFAHGAASVRRSGFARACLIDRSGFARARLIDRSGFARACLIDRSGFARARLIDRSGFTHRARLADGSIAVRPLHGRPLAVYGGCTLAVNCGALPVGRITAARGSPCSASPIAIAGNPSAVPAVVIAPN
jgi:hypothetical protein